VNVYGLLSVVKLCQEENRFPNGVISKRYLFRPRASGMGTLFRRGFLHSFVLFGWVCGVEHGPEPVRKRVPQARFPLVKLLVRPQIYCENSGNYWTLFGFSVLWTATELLPETVSVDRP
jgi:hypothetical protein